MVQRQKDRLFLCDLDSISVLLFVTHELVTIGEEGRFKMLAIKEKSTWAFYIISDIYYVITCISSKVSGY